MLRKKKRTNRKRRKGKKLLSIFQGNTKYSCRELYHRSFLSTHSPLRFDFYRRAICELALLCHPSIPDIWKACFCLVHELTRLHIASLIHMHRWKKQQYEEHPRVYSRITRCARLSLPFYLHTSQISFDSRSNEYLQGLNFFFFEDHAVFAFPFPI